MTIRQLYEGVLTEVNKENSPNLILEDFNYFTNKAINQYVNKRYNIYDVNQQTTDDLRVLKSTAVLIPIKSNYYNGFSLSNMATYYVDLPSDYLHLLNCFCVYNVRKTFKCYRAGDTWRAAATRLTADAYSQVMDNFWLKPSYKRPYYYIHNINTSSSVPTNPYKTKVEYDIKSIPENKITPVPGIANEYYYVEYIQSKDFLNTGQYIKNTYDTIITPDGPEKGNKLISTEVLYSQVRINKKIVSGTDSSTVQEEPTTDAHGNKIINGSGNPTYININDGYYSNVERGKGIRYGNVSNVRLEIRYGSDDSVFTLSQYNNDGTIINPSEDDPTVSKGGYIYIDYLKAPQFVCLTQDEIDSTMDNSQVLEFPDYVCQEILNELVILIMERNGDPHLQTFPVVSQSIANPTQAQAPETTG